MFPPEGLPQLGHATNDGTGYGSSTGEENTHNHAGRSYVSRWSCASRHAYDRKTNKEPGPGTSERTK